MFNIQNILCAVFVVLGIIAAIIYVREKNAGYTIKALALKTIASCLFLLTSLAAISKGGSGLIYGCFIIAGQIFGLLGDVWLDLKYVYRSDDVPHSFSGFKSFSTGHVFFLVGMIIRFGDASRPLYIILGFVFGIIAGFLVVPMGKIMKLDFGRFKVISCIYGMLLFSTAGVSFALALMAGFTNPSLNILFAGAAAFAISDLVLSRTYFGTDHEKTIDFILNYLFYYGAQFLISLSILFA